MSIDEYKNEMAIQFGYLDKIDIEGYMNNCKTQKVSELISAIERDYDNTDFTNNDFLQGCIFNRCSEEEFIEYLGKRYGSRLRLTEHCYHTFRLQVQ